MLCSRIAGLHSLRTLPSYLLSQWSIRPRTVHHSGKDADTQGEKEKQNEGNNQEDAEEHLGYLYRSARNVRVSQCARNESDNECYDGQF